MCGCFVLKVVKFELSSDEKTIIDFVRSQPLRKIHGIGPISEATLKGIGLNTGDFWFFFFVDSYPAF